MLCYNNNTDTRSMNLSMCPNHPDRKEEMMCLTDQCPQRFTPRCIQCMMGSTCRQSHNWKMVSEIVEEIYQVCESTEVKDEKNKKEKKPANPVHLQTKRILQKSTSQFKEKAAQLQKHILAKVDARVKKLTAKLDSETENYTVVKELLKTLKKETESKDLNQRLKEVSHYITCTKDGSLQLVDVDSSQGLDDNDLSKFHNQNQELIDNLAYIIEESNEMPSQVQDLKKSYQQQIDKLLEQTKQLPVLQNRVVSLNEKLQAKDVKLKKYESGGVSESREKSEGSLKKIPSTQDQETKNSKKVGRIQTLIDKRQQLRNTLIKYCQKSPQQELYIYNLGPNQRTNKLQIPVGTQIAYLLNECILSVADQLQFLDYSDSTGSDPHIEIPLIAVRKQQKQPKAQKQPMNPFLELFGLMK